MTQALYDQVVAITEEYLGPAAPRFVARQVTYHFHKPPHELTAEDLPKLVDWTRVTLGLLTENQHLIEECAERILQLTANKPA